MLLIRIFPLLFFPFLLACKKDKLEANIWLVDKPLPVIQKYVTGKFEFLYTMGGIVGGRIDRPPGEYLTISSTRIIWTIPDGSTFADSQITWLSVTDFRNRKTYYMSFEDKRGYPMGFIVESIENGNLWLVENGPDGFGYCLRRLPQ